MGRHKTRREMINANRNACRSAASKQWKYRACGFAIGVVTCMIFATYFSFSAPNNVEAQSREVAGEWHELKHNWSVERLTPEQFNIVANSIDLMRLKEEYLKHLLVVRPSGSEEIQEVRRFLVGTMQDLDWKVEEDTFTEKPPDPHPVTEFTNVIATLNPNARRRLVLACHYDSKLKPTGFLGATDSAVPCAMMLEMAQALRNQLFKYHQDSDLTLQYIFFDGEEAFERWTAKDSIYGARHLAARWEGEKWPDQDSDKTVLDGIDLFVLLDLLGAANPMFYDNRHTFTRHYKELAKIEKNLDDKLRYFQTHVSNSMIEDDHIPFLRRKVPVLHLIPSPFPRQWHTIDDNEKILNDRTILRLTRIIAVFVTEYLHMKPTAF